MPNIMLTSRCNLHCSYCFANNMVNQNNATDITIENFKTALNFITSSGSTDIGLIGGEPTLNHNFKDIVTIAIEDPLVNIITLCTNGIELENYMDLISHEKIQVLFNCNTEPNISSTQKQRMLNNIDKYFSNSNNKGTLGINVYNDKLDCSYIFELAKKYNQHIIRLSLTVPSMQTCSELTYFEYLQTRKDKLRELVELSKKYNIVFSFDCDIPPICELITLPGFKYDPHIQRNKCTPIIDITPNLMAVRCFGTSHLYQVSILDFENLDALRNYFIRNIDEPMSKILIKSRCENCIKRKKLECFGGCIRFKN